MILSVCDVVRRQAAAPTRETRIRSAGLTDYVPADVTLLMSPPSSGLISTSSTAPRTERSLGTRGGR